MINDQKYIADELKKLCSKNKKNKQLHSIKNIKCKKVRAYSIFRTGLRCFKRCLYEDRKKYYLKISFIVYK